MTQRLEHINLLLDELQRHGLRGEVGERGKHLEVRWATPHGERFVIAPRTPSDWRSAMNCRSDLRKLLRADGVEAKKPEPSFQKAMSLPEPVLVTKSDREHALQQDVEILTDMVFELQGQLEGLKRDMTEVIREQLRSLTVVSKIQFAEQASGVVEDLFTMTSTEHLLAASGERKMSKKEQVLALLSAQFRPRKWIMEQAVKTIDTTQASVNQILAKAKREGLVETGLRGMWRLKP